VEQAEKEQAVQVPKKTLFEKGAFGGKIFKAIRAGAFGCGAAAETNNFLNKKCGLLGLYGPSSDCRDIENAVREGNPRAILAHKTFSYRVLKYIGAYAAAMNGADLIVFTGGIGENDAHVRELIGTRLGYLGVTFDKEKNKTVRGEDTILSTNSSGTKIAVISTDEELVIATDTLNLTN
jgi:acetate kinase